MGLAADVLLRVEYLCVALAMEVAVPDLRKRDTLDEELAPRDVLAAVIDEAAPLLKADVVIAVLKRVQPSACLKLE